MNFDKRMNEFNRTECYVIYCCQLKWVKSAKNKNCLQKSFENGEMKRIYTSMEITKRYLVTDDV